MFNSTSFNSQQPLQQPSQSPREGAEQQPKTSQTPLQKICQQALETLKTFNLEADEQNKASKGFFSSCCSDPIEKVNQYIFDILERYASQPVGHHADILLHTMDLSECSRSTREIEVQLTLSSVIQELGKHDPSKRTIETQTYPTLSDGDAQISSKEQSLFDKIQGTRRVQSFDSHASPSVFYPSARNFRDDPSLDYLPRAASLQPTQQQQTGQDTPRNFFLTRRSDSGPLDEAPKYANSFDN